MVLMTKDELIRSLRVNVSKFKLGYDRPGHFYSSQWQNDPENEVSILYLTLRVVLLLFMVVNYIVNLVDRDSDDLRFFLIYMTNQGLTILVAHHLVITGMVLWNFYAICAQDEDQREKRTRFTAILIN